MAQAPRALEIRAYQVGFGDCFLLSFVYGDRDRRHVLIDFGTTGLPRGATPSVHMPRVAADIGSVCGGRLTAVVATHRHADHISGFATDGRTGRSGETIKQLRPRVVLQPWTEDPRAATDATTATTDSRRSGKSFVAGLAAMHEVARSVHDLARLRPPWMSAALQRELTFIGLDNIANESAVRNLIAMGEAPGATAVWAHHGSRSGLERHLPGVTVHVLGPPSLKQTESIKKMRSKDPDEFWHLMAGFQALPAARRAGRRPSGRPAAGSLPPEARWFRDRLDRMRGEQLLQIVRTLDDQMNNTSLILLFEVLGKRLLFPGDAQLENWSYALEEAPDRDHIRRLLAGVDVYKVGHHGSLNATPRTLLWEKFAKRGKPGPGRLRAILSTLPGKHGKAQSKTEVPRRTLLAALADETTLCSTTTLPSGKQNAVLCHRIDIPGAR
jgi:hypothetical protein